MAKYKVGDRVVLGDGGYHEIGIGSLGWVADIDPSDSLYEIDADDLTESNREVLRRTFGFDTLPYWESEIEGWPMQTGDRIRVKAGLTSEAMWFSGREGTVIPPPKDKCGSVMEGMVWVDMPKVDLNPVWFYPDELERVSG